MIPNLAAIVSLYILWRLSEPFWLDSSRYKSTGAHIGAKWSGVAVSLLVLVLLYEIFSAGTQVTGNLYGLSDFASPSLESLSSATDTPSVETEEARHRKEVQEYLPNVKLYALRGGYGKGTLSCYNKPCPTYRGKIKNEGNRTLTRVEITAYFPDAEGNIIYEDSSSPVLVADFSVGDNTPLKPNYIREFGYVVEDCPSECKPRKVRIEITDLAFEEQKK